MRSFILAILIVVGLVGGTSSPAWAAPHGPTLADGGIETDTIPAADAAESMSIAPPAALDPSDHPLGALELLVSLYRRGYLAAVAHLLLFWFGLAALARSGWLTAHVSWLARGRVLVFVSGMVANLSITLPAVVTGSATWGGIAVAIGGGLALWIQPYVTKLADAGVPAATAT